MFRDMYPHQQKPGTLIIKLKEMEFTASINNTWLLLLNFNHIRMPDTSVRGREGFYLFLFIDYSHISDYNGFADLACSLDLQSWARALTTVGAFQL